MTNRHQTTGYQERLGKNFFYGWWVLAALFVVGMFGPMGRYILSALAPFIQEELLWTKSEMGVAFSIHFWVYSFIVLLIGWIIDRIGSQRVIFLGGLILLAALVLLSRLSNLWQLYLVFGVLIALGVSMTHLVPNQATSRKWFVKKAGLAGGIITAAFGIGLAVLSPVLTAMSAAIGWRTALFICALAFGIIIMLLAALVIRDTPESIGLHPNGAAEAPREAEVDASTTGEVWTPREALYTLPFWLLFIAFSLPAIPMQGMLTQVVIWGSDLGESSATAGIFLTAITLPSIPAKMLGGWLGDRYGKRTVLIFTNGACFLAMLGAWLAVSSASSLLILAVLFGISYGLPMGLVPAYLGDLYGRTSLGTLLGIQVFGSTLVGGFGPLIWGRVADITGSYNQACLISAITYVIAIVALILIKRGKLVEMRREKQSPT